MRMLYAPLYEGIQLALHDIFEGGFHADKVIQRQLKLNKKWGSHDRRLFSEVTYDTVRWWRRLLFALDRESQLSAAYGPAVQLWCHLHGVELERKIPRLTGLAEAAQRWEAPGLSRAVRFSIPDWLDEWGQAQLLERWERVLTSLNQEAPVFLRANRLKITAEELLQRLHREKIEAEHVGGDALMLKRRLNVFLSPSFKAGFFELQDLHSQKVAEILAPQKGERVVDACAGGGGKTLHLAALMQNKGRILALDIQPKKLEALRERARRAGASLIETREIDSSKVIKRLADSADRLLLDVPCTGLGVLRRNPDAKWKLKPDDVPRVVQLQREILSSYSQMVKVGGVLVYSTCSIMADENERQIEGFLSQHETGWKAESQQTFYPAENQGDGFFIARLKRQS